MSLDAPVAEAGSPPARRDEAGGRHPLLPEQSELSREIRARYLDPGTHPRTLSLIAAEALRRGRPGLAYVLADRRCRITPAPDARDHVLRAEAARHLGFGATANAALARAVEIDPTDDLVNVHALALPDPDARVRAARALVDSPTRGLDPLRRALAVLAEAGVEVVGHLARSEDRAEGFVAWTHDEALRCVIRRGGKEEERTLAPAPNHPLATSTLRASRLALVVPRDETVEVRCFRERQPDKGYRITFGPTPPANPGRARHGEVPPGPPQAEAPEPRGEDAGDEAPERTAKPWGLTVIVPVFEDADATRACLDTLKAQVIPGCRWRTLVVNDASPNARLVQDLRERAERGEVTLIDNGFNLGFAASVNLAAASVGSGHLLLLNADTLLPPGSLARLVLRAAGTPDLGTLTPLSNNGVITDFPFSESGVDLPPEPDLLEWDRAAAEADTPAVDLQNGIGFCMLVTRACWDAVGGLSEAYGRGYYEDVDLCLRARDLGFRNLCATNVVVGHAGSRSFQAGKRALVVRNVGALSLRFPGYPAEYAAFRRDDPLAPARAAIERRITPAHHDILLVTASPQSAALRPWRAWCETAGKSCMILNPEGGPDGAVALRSTTPGPPQSLAFGLDDAAERGALLDYLRAVAPSRIAAADPECWDERLIDLILELALPLEIILEAPTAAVATGRARGTSVDAGAAHDPGDSPAGTGLERMLPQADLITCSDLMTFAHATRALPSEHWSKLTLLRNRSPSSLAAPALAGDGDRPALLGILCPLPNGAAMGLIRALSDRARQVEPATRILVLGASLSDTTLMADGISFVTGAIEGNELAEMLSRFGCDSLVLPYRDRLFYVLEGLPEGVARQRAYFDWAGSPYLPKQSDLALDPALSDGEAAERILRWHAAGLGL